VRPDVTCDTARWWQAYDRTVGEPLSPAAWRLEEDGHTVTVLEPQAGHAYTVSYLATQTWDPTQMYNYLTNGWDQDPTRVKEKP
ncbi:1,3-beta-galactosyl-N-acetylhexosamine phosphorylase N-terminal domain-containing protein, partial [Actinotignum schaalii]